MAIKKICEQCGKEFKTNNKKALFCEKNCYYESLKKTHVLKCKQCGKEFLCNREDALFCNRDCYYKSKQPKPRYCVVCGKLNKTRGLTCSEGCRYKNSLSGNEYLIFDNYAVICMQSQGKQINTIIDIEDVEKCKEYTWYLTRTRRNKNVKWGRYYVVSQRNRKTIKLHRYLMDCPDDMVIDHIDRETLNNRKHNLRIIKSEENALNMTYDRKTVTGEKYIIKCRTSFSVQIKRNGFAFRKTVKTLENAILLRDKILEENRHILLLDF